MAVKFRNQIVGLMRFSYPSRGGFTKSGAEREEANTTLLYDPARLERRFHLFENLTLPSLLAQSDQDFRMVFLIGRDLPKSWRDRLSDAVAPLGGAQVLALGSLQHYLAVRRAFAVGLSGKATHITGFRLDDDDALDYGHVARMRATVEALAPITGLEAPLVTGSNCGFFLECKPEGNQLYEVVEKSPIGIGLAMTTPAESSENIFRRNHRFVTQFYNTYTDATRPAFIRSIHADNDSDPHCSGRIERVDWAEAAPVLESCFPFTVEVLQRL
ncbi:MAG: putative rhamnosyl transferase [Gemmobacter sp.]|nr:putative rhamnosyl transferase [Gemmobacter sp.]